MDTTDRIIRMLDSEEGEIAIAAALVLGRLRPVEQRVVEALRGALRRAPASARSYFLDALAATQDACVLEDVVNSLLAGENGSEQAIRILRRFGAKTLAHVTRIHEGHEGWLGGAWIKVVAGIPQRDAIRMLFDKLPHCNWEQARATSLFIRENWEIYPEPAKALARRRVKEFLATPKRLPPHALVTCLKLRRPVGDPLDATEIAAWCGPGQESSVRRHALEILAETPLSPPDEEVVRHALFSALADGIHREINTAALHVATGASAPAFRVEQLEELLGRKNLSVAAFAMDEMARIAPRVALRRLPDFLMAPHPRQRIAAMEALLGIQGGPSAVLAALTGDAPEPRRRELAENLLRSGVRFSPAVMGAWRRRWTDQVLSEGRYERAVLEVLARTDSGGFNAYLRRRAKTLFAAGRFHDVIAILQPLVRWRHADPANRLWLALANIEAAGEPSPADPRFQRGLSLIRSLRRVTDFPLAHELGRAPLSGTRRASLASVLASYGPAATLLARELRQNP